MLATNRSWSGVADNAGGGERVAGAAAGAAGVAAPYVAAGAACGSAPSSGAAGGFEYGKSPREAKSDRARRAFSSEVASWALMLSDSVAPTAADTERAKSACLASSSRELLASRRIRDTAL
jgi:hypothetical protein